MKKPPPTSLELPPFIWQSTAWPNLTWDSEILEIPLQQARLKQKRLLTKVAALRFKQGFLTLLPSSKFNGDGLLPVLSEATQNAMQPLTAQRTKSWHRMLFPAPTSEREATGIGDWRGTEPMHIATHQGSQLLAVHYKAPPGEAIEAEMAQFFDWWQKSLENTDGLLRAGLAHLRFLTIHPFEDGNGRIARVLVDMALAQDEQLADRYYYVSSQIQAERYDYFAVLESTQKGDGNVTPWLEWFLGCYQRALMLPEKMLATISE